MQNRPGGPEVRSVYRRRNFSGKAFARRLRWHLLKSQGGSPSPAWKISCAPASPLASGVFPAWHLMSQHGLSGRQSKGLAARTVFCVWKAAGLDKTPERAPQQPPALPACSPSFHLWHDSGDFFVCGRNAEGRNLWCGLPTYGKTTKNRCGKHCILTKRNNGAKIYSYKII